MTGLLKSPGATEAAETFTAVQRSGMRRRLLAWYRRHARDLPWRRDRDAYRIWISEVMLQQTQVATVVPYFERFIDRFGDVASLASSREEEVLRLWEGLGYYRRARQLHAAARRVMSEHGGQLPRSAAALRLLPGIGRYTAAAIASIAYDQREAILEANTKRLLARLAGLRCDPDAGRGQRYLWNLAEAMLPRRRSGEFNQALMELGGLVCRPDVPQCTRCPLARFCRARSMGQEHLIPPPKRRSRVEAVREAAIVVWRRGRVLLIRQRDGERWAGLWDFPRFVLEQRDASAHKALQVRLRQKTGIRIRWLGLLTVLRHGVTRYRITLECHQASYAGSDHRVHPVGEQIWTAPDEWDQYPCHATGRRIRLLLSREPGR